MIYGVSDQGKKSENCPRKINKKKKNIIYVNFIIMKRGRQNGGDRNQGGKVMKRGGRQNNNPIRSQVKKFLLSEMDLKGVDSECTGVVGSDLTTNGGICIINGLKMGNGSFRRADKQVTGRSLRCRFGITYSYKEELLSGDVEAQFVRVSVVIDKKPSDAFPTWSSIFANLDEDGAFTQNLRSSVSFKNTDRFRVLRDEEITFNPMYMHKGGLLTDTLTMREDRDWFIDLKNLKTEWAANSTTTLIADMEENAIYFVIRASSNTVHSTFSFHTSNRFRYIDL